MRHVGAQGAEAPGRMCCGRPKSVNRVVMANYEVRRCVTSFCLTKTINDVVQKKLSKVNTLIVA